MTKDKSNDRPPYEIGYGKPPKKHRFKKGESGNYSGRKPDPNKNMYEMVEDVFYQKRKAKIAGKEMKIANIELVLYKLLEVALSGEIKAISLLYKFADKFNITPPKMEVFGPFMPTRAQIKAQDPDFNGENENGEEDDL